MRLSLISLLFFPFIVTAQSFHQVYPAWEHNALQSVLHWNGDTVFTGGNNMSLLRSIDAGNTWNEMILNDFAYDILQLATDGNEIYMRVDVPYSWKILYDSSWFDMFAFNPYTRVVRKIEVPRIERTHFYSDCRISISEGTLFFYAKQYPGAHGELVSIVLYTSPDGGNIWVPAIAPIEHLNSMSDVAMEFVTTSTGVLLCDSIPNDVKLLYRTTDGGNSWEKTARLPRGQGRSILTKSRSYTGTLVYGNGLNVFVSRDSGATWQPTSAIPWIARSVLVVAGIYLSSNEELFVAGIEGDMYRSTDFGTSWTVLREPSLPYADHTLGVKGIDGFGTTMILACTGGDILTSHNAGLTWQQQHRGEFRSVVVSHFFDSDKGFIFGNNQDGDLAVFASSNSGQTWTGNLTGEQINSNVFHFESWNSIFIVEYALAENEYVLKHSTDQGITWSRRSFWQIVGTAPVPASIAGAGNLLLVAVNSELYRSTDGGYTFTAVTRPSWRDKPLNLSLGFDYAGNIRCYGYSEPNDATNLFASSDSGLTWKNIPSYWYMGKIKAVSVLSSDTVVVHVMLPGNQEKIERSTDGGENWNNLYSGPTLGFNRFIDFQSVSYGIMNRTCVYKSNDNWQTRKELICISDDPTVMEPMQFLDENNGWIVTNFAVYRTTNGGTDWIESPLPVAGSASIRSIYPNPVTTGSTTSIEIDVPVASNTNTSARISVYGILGREVALLHEGRLAPGPLALSWRPAPSLPAGVYTLKLQIGDTVSTRHVAVVK